MTVRSRTSGPAVSRLEERRRAADRASNASYTGRRKEIVDAAAVLFAAKGYEATSLADIAEAVGIDRATLYYYYKAKTEIIGTAVTQAMAATLAVVDDIVARDIDATEKVRRLIERLATAFAENYPFGSLYFQDDIWRSADALWTQSLRRDEARINHAVLQIIADGQRAGSIRDDLPPRLIFDTCFGAVFWSYRWFKPGCGYSAAEVTRAFEALLFHGMTPPASSPKGAPRS